MSDLLRSTEIAERLEALVTREINEFADTLNRLNIPLRLQVPLWRAMARRAEAKAAEYEREAGR